MEMEAAMVVCGNEGEVEENGILCSVWTGILWEAVRSGALCVVGVVAWGHRLQSLCVNRSVGGADGGVEELTVQVKWFLLLN